MTVVAVLIFIASFAQQHSYTPAEVDDGRRIYQTRCATCHGALGDAIPEIDLGRGQFRKAATDEDLVRIIRNGIPDTTMPPFNFSEPQLGSVVAYLRNMKLAPVDRNAPAPGPPGDPTRGKAVFETKGDCLSCHSMAGAGNIAGPDLTVIGVSRGLRSPAELYRSLVEPNAEVRSENRTIRVVTKAGTTLTGRLLNQDTHSLQMLDSGKGLASFLKSDLVEFGLVLSPMPSFKERLTAQELSDIISYLLSPKGAAP